MSTNKAASAVISAAEAAGVSPRSENIEQLSCEY